MATITGTIKAISISAQRGVAKTNVARAQLQYDHGLVGDAHAGSGHRQVSLLAVEAIDEMAARPRPEGPPPARRTAASPAARRGCTSGRSGGRRVGPGDFAENITTEGLDLGRLRIGSRLRLGPTAELEITQFGKQCHGRCAIFQQIGDCVMPREGIFARVVRSGWIAAGDRIEVCDDSSCSADHQ